MAGDSEKEAIEDVATDVTALGDTEEPKHKKKNEGLLSRMWKGIFRLHGDDFEKRLQYISKEEAAILSRLKRRSQRWRRLTRQLIILSVLLEAVAVGYAIMTTRSLELNWKMRALRVLPMFLLPFLSFITHSALGSFIKMCEHKDKKNLENLRAERQAKIDELKERTNYYTTQQLIQRYDTDPAAKAAAATILASKLGADSGLKVYLEDESQLNAPTGKSNDVELPQQVVLRNRKHLHTRTKSADSTVADHPEEERLLNMELEGPENAQNHQMLVEHFQPIGSNPHDGSWISKLAALLVGEDPSQSYALICGNCHMHNGLARKEDFPYITYYCPHCNALNEPKHQAGRNGPNISSSITSHSGGEEVVNDSSSMVDMVPRSTSTDKLMKNDSCSEVNTVPTSSLETAAADTTTEINPETAAADTTTEINPETAAADATEINETLPKTSSS